MNGEGGGFRTHCLRWPGCYLVIKICRSVMVMRLVAVVFQIKAQRLAEAMEKLTRVTPSNLNNPDYQARQTAQSIGFHTLK